MKSLSKYFLPVLIALSALSVSASAAFYSVFGLSKLFAGASLEVIIMASSLEISKLVIASLLYRYWSELNKILRTYLTLAVTILIIITSLGIYGFLSSAYQETANQLSVIDKQVQFLKQKESFYQDDVNRFDSELERISNTIGVLSQAKASEIQVRDTSVVGGIRNTISTTELRLAQARIDVEESNRKEIQEKRTIAADSLQSIQLSILELESNNELAAELGPLKYISGLLGIGMDRIVNVLLLIIVFVFDPLAVSLVVAANFAFDKASKSSNYEEYSDEPNDKLKNAILSFIYDPDDDKSDEEIFENSQEDLLDEEESKELKEKPFNETYTGEKETLPKVVKVLQKTPSHRYVVLDNGKKVKVTKDQVNPDLSLRYL